MGKESKDVLDSSISVKLLRKKKQTKITYRLDMQANLVTVMEYVYFFFWVGKTI